GDGAYVERFALRESDGQTDDRDAERVVAANLVLCHCRAVSGHNQQSGARLNFADSRGRVAEVGVVVLDDPVVFDCRVAADFRRVGGQEEDQNAARVVVNVVVFDQRVNGIFDLDASDVVVRFAIFDDDVARLADVDRRVFDARGQYALDEHAFAFDRVDAVEACVVDFQVAECRVTAAVNGDAV